MAKPALSVKLILPLEPSSRQVKRVEARILAAKVDQAELDVDGRRSPDASLGGKVPQLLAWKEGGGKGVRRGDDSLPSLIDAAADKEPAEKAAARLLDGPVVTSRA